MINHLCAWPLTADPTPNYLRLCIPYQIAGAVMDGFVDLTTVRSERLAERVDKFRSCAEYGAEGWDTDRTERVIDLVARLEDLPDVGELTDLL